MAAVGGLFEAAFLTCLKIVIAHQPGDPVASGDDTVFHEIGVHARAPISLPRHAKALADMGKKHHVFALAFTCGAIFPSEITTLADFESLAKACKLLGDILMRTLEQIGLVVLGSPPAQRGFRNSEIVCNSLNAAPAGH